MFRKLLLGLTGIFLTFCGLFGFPLEVKANLKISEEIEPDRKISVTIQYDVPGIEFELYRIFDIETDGSLSVSEQFKPLQDTVDFSQMENESERAALAATLDVYASLEEYSCDYSALVAENGTAVFENVDPGVYLLKSESHLYEQRSYLTQPVLFYAPQENTEEDRWDYEITLIPKFETDLALKDPLKIIKVWRDQDNAQKLRPEEITVELRLDGKPYTEVVLNEENNWTYVWDDIPIESDYLVVEKNVPKGYVVSYETAGNEISSVHTIINTVENPKKPPKKPNTGASSGWLEWLCIGGLSLICLGLFAGAGKRKKI